MRSPTSLRAKLVVLLALPLVVLVAVAAVSFRTANRAADEARATAKRLDLAVAASAAALELAQERALSASTLVAAPADGQAAVPEELEFQRGQTSEAVETLRRVADPGTDDPPLGSALERLGRLADTRESVDDRGSDTDEVLRRYDQLIDPVLDFDETLADLDDPELLTGIGSHEALTRGIRDVALEQALLTRVFTTSQIDASTYERLVRLLTSQDLWLDLFADKANPSQRAGYDELAAVPAVATVQRLREQALAAGPGGAVQADAEVWSSATGRKLDLLESIAEDTADQLSAAADTARSDARRRWLTSLGLLLAAVWLAAGLLFLLHRSVIRPLRKLVRSTRRAVVEQTPVGVPPEEELRDLASAFNVLAEEAPRAAAPSTSAQAAASDGVYLSFGRRTQELITQQLRHIDDLEARTEDPDTLADLFLLDHLATRLRRNAESQVVVAGADSPRPWARPVSVTNVVRAAAAEASDYSRVDVQPMPPATVVGDAANDVSHLLAELIDDALGSVPDHLRVTVSGSWRPDGRFGLSVSGVGLRLSPVELSQANERLGGRAPTTDGDPSHGFTLYVVARLAHRHDMDVQLVPAPGGTAAEVVLPSSVLADATSRPTSVAVTQAPVPSAAPAASSAASPAGSPVVAPIGPTKGPGAGPTTSHTAPRHGPRPRASTDPPRPERRSRRLRWPRRKVIERSPKSGDPWAEWQE